MAAKVFLSDGDCGGVRHRSFISVGNRSCFRLHVASELHSAAGVVEIFRADAALSGLGNRFVRGLIAGPLPSGQIDRVVARRRIEDGTGVDPNIQKAKRAPLAGDQRDGAAATCESSVWHYESLMTKAVRRPTSILRKNKRMLNGKPKTLGISFNRHTFGCFQSCTYRSGAHSIQVRQFLSDLSG